MPLSDVEKGYVVKKRNLGWSCNKIASTMHETTKEEIEQYLKDICWKKLPRMRLKDRIGASVRAYNQSKKPVSLAPLPSSWT